MKPIRHEVCSCGFWPGSEGLPFPVFYAYAYPEPAGFKTAKVKPAEAYYEANYGEFILPPTPQVGRPPDAMVLEFFQSTYEAAADLAKWNPQRLDAHGGLCRAGYRNEPAGPVHPLVFSDLSIADVPLVGGKNASLGVDVPRAFVARGEGAQRLRADRRGIPGDVLTLPGMPGRPCAAALEGLNAADVDDLARRARTAARAGLQRATARR